MRTTRAGGEVGVSGRGSLPLLCLLVTLALPVLAGAQDAPSPTAPSAGQPQTWRNSGESDAQHRAVTQGPRILLFWNVPFDEETQSTQAQTEVTQEARGPEHMARGLTSHGPAELHATFNTPLESAKQHPWMVAREEAVLESAFREHLHLAGVHLLDRATSIRFTAAEKDREGVDPKLIESDAIKSKADILLEILMVTDFESPLGRGFNVKATQVATGEEITSFYTLAQPTPPPRAGRYVGTDEGFKWEPPPPWIPSPDAVGRTLAQEVLVVLAGTSTNTSHQEGR